MLRQPHLRAVRMRAEKSPWTCRKCIDWKTFLYHIAKQDNSATNINVVCVCMPCKCMHMIISYLYVNELSALFQKGKPGLTLDALCLGYVDLPVPSNGLLGALLAQTLKASVCC